MTAYPAWTPASRPGIVPLRPYGFGITLGRSFTALRENPRVLLGFALLAQAVAYIVLIVAVAGVSIASFSRLDTLRQGTEEFDAVLAGSVALTAVTGIVLGLATGALTLVVQAIVIAEVAHEVTAEKVTLGVLWRRVRPVLWRLIGYSLLVLAVALTAFAVVGGLLFVIGLAALPLAVGGFVLAVLGAIPLTIWISVKLSLVPAVLVLEQARVFPAIARSWLLVRGRFWPTLGVLALISLTFGVVAQLVSVPLTFLGTGLSTLFAPTGSTDVTAVIGIVAVTVLTQVITLLVQCVALVVQATGVTLIYVDCRMRREGLDLDLQQYVDARDAGATDLPDPYRVHIGRVVAPRPPQPFAPAGYPPPGAYVPPPPPYVPPTAPPVPEQPPTASAPPPADDGDDDPATRWTAPGQRPESP